VRQQDRVALDRPDPATNARSRLSRAAGRRPEPGAPWPPGTVLPVPRRLEVLVNRGCERGGGSRAARSRDNLVIEVAKQAGITVYLTGTGTVYH